MKLFLTVFAILILVSGGTSQIISHLSAEDVCYGDTVQVSCLVRDISSYAITIPQWNQNDNLLIPDAINLEVLHYNTTAYALSVMVTRELFTGSSLAYSCFLIRPDSTKDASEDQVISPLERPKSPELTNVTFSHDGATISWTHNPVCYSNCTFLFNVTLHQAVQPNNTLSVDGTTTEENNVTFAMLSVDVIYQAMVTAYCMEEPDLFSEPLEVKFNGTQFNTPTDGTSPTTTATTNPTTIPTEIATLSTGAIVGIAIAAAVVVCLLIAVVVVVVVVVIIMKQPLRNKSIESSVSGEESKIVNEDKHRGQLFIVPEAASHQGSLKPLGVVTSKQSIELKKPLAVATRAQSIELKVGEGDKQIKHYDLHFEKFEDRSCWVHVEMEQNFDDERTIRRRIIEVLEHEGFAITT